MCRIFCCALLLVLPVSVLPASALSAEPALQEILKSVARRDERTGAILSVQPSAEMRAKGSPTVYHQFEIQIDDKTAIIEMYNNYLTGKKGEKFTYPIGPEIEAEFARLQNLARLRKLDAAVAAAQRQRRIFVLSSFALQEGSRYEQVEKVFGKPAKHIPWMKAGWDTLVYRDVAVTLAFGKVHDIQANVRK